jgi:hypothetical protein
MPNVLQLRQALEDKTKRARVLASITALKKLCNHPKVCNLPVSFIVIVSKVYRNFYFVPHQIELKDHKNTYGTEKAR